MTTVYSLKADKYSSHMQIAEFIKSLGLLPHSKILDVGCSKGFLGKNLSKLNFDLYGIEMDKNDAKMARLHYKDIKICDLDFGMPVFKENFFDAIVMADVLEHLKNPLKALRHFKRFSKNGYIIISTGNVANIWIRINLLFGRFDYTGKGILDRTHVHLYTLKNFKSLADEAGLGVKQVFVTPIPLPLVSDLFSKGNIFHLLHKINYMLAFLWKNLFGYQFILVCEKK